MAEDGFEVVPLGADQVEAFQPHFERHVAESGRGEAVFMPFSPDGSDGPKGLDAGLLRRPLSEPDWQRLWVAEDVTAGEIVGHVDLKGDFLRAGLHRCHLGLGVERAYRRRGLGRRLVEVAVDFARREETLAWIDLKVFAHNAGARALYESVGMTAIRQYEEYVLAMGSSAPDQETP